MSAHDRHQAATALRDVGDALRSARTQRARLRERAAAIATIAGALTLTIALPPVPLLVWNASPSVPIGLYVIGGNTGLNPGDLVVARVPERYRALAAIRQYLPQGVPLVKTIGAVAGDDVCAADDTIKFNRRVVAHRLRRDGAGRLMPWWQGCARLRGGQMFLLTRNPVSFDGRYIGLTNARDVIGKARLLWPG